MQQFILRTDKNDYLQKKNDDINRFYLSFIHSLHTKQIVFILGRILSSVCTRVSKPVKTLFFFLGGGGFSEIKSRKNGVGGTFLPFATFLMYKHSRLSLLINNVGKIIIYNATLWS